MKLRFTRQDLADALILMAVIVCTCIVVAGGMQRNKLERNKERRRIPLFVHRGNTMEIIKPKHRTRPKQAEPTLAEIEAACAEIRSTWTPAETLKRLRSDMRPTYIRCDQVREEMEASVYGEHIEGQMPLGLRDEDYDDLPD